MPITWVRTEDQLRLVLVIFAHNTKLVILGISSIPFKVFQVHTQHTVIIWGQAVDFVQSEPKFAIQITETNFVIAPVEEKINRAVQSLLEYCPPPTGCCVVTKHIKGRHIVRFDGVHAVFSFTRFVDSTAVFEISCNRKEIMKIATRREFVPGRNCFIRGVPAGAVYSEEKCHTNMVIRTYVCVGFICNYGFRFTLRVIFENSLKIAQAIMRVQISRAFVPLLRHLSYD